MRGVHNYKSLKIQVSHCFTIGEWRAKTDFFGASLYFFGLQKKYRLAPKENNHARFFPKEKQSVPV